MLAAGSDALQKRCHSPRPPCLGDLPKATHFVSSAEPRITRNANFFTSSFAPKRLLKEQGNQCSHWLYPEPKLGPRGELKAASPW